MKLDLPYLFAPKGRNRRYYYYRRNGLRVPIEDAAGTKLTPADPGFLDAYVRTHEQFEADTPASGWPRGSLGHVIEAYKSSPDFAEKSAKTRKDYRRYMDEFQQRWGKLFVATMPREFVRKLRDLNAATPRTANYKVSVLRLLLSFAEDQPTAFLLPRNWQNPARRPKKLKTGDGHRPWEEHEIAAYRERWPVDTIERVIFELFLNTGQRGQDGCAMTRKHYRAGTIHVAQLKTSARVWVPASRDLRSVLDPWIKAHKHVVLLSTPTGRSFKEDHLRHVFRDACRAAGLPDDCTLHGLRYTAATILHELGCDWTTIAAITGHETAEMVRKYTEKKRLATLAIARLDDARAAAQAERGGNSQGDDL